MSSRERATAVSAVALGLLAHSPIHYGISFIVGCPGETPELFEDTKNFLVNKYEGNFAFYVFMLNDETIPVWQDAEKFGLEVFDADGDRVRYSPWVRHRCVPEPWHSGR